MEPFYCNYCTNNLRYIECISEKLYISSIILTILFNKAGVKNCLQILHAEDPTIKNYIKSYLTHIKVYNHLIFSYNWRGINYYYDRLAIVPPILINIGICPKHYLFRKCIYFDDYIKGHPKASNGWFNEAIEEFDSYNI